MPVLVNKPAPDFKTNGVMPDGSVKEISLSDYNCLLYTSDADDE